MTDPTPLTPDSVASFYYEKQRRLHQKSIDIVVNEMKQTVTYESVRDVLLQSMSQGSMAGAIDLDVTLVDRVDPILLNSFVKDATCDYMRHIISPDHCAYTVKQSGQKWRLLIDAKSNTARK